METQKFKTKTSIKILYIDIIKYLKNIFMLSFVDVNYSLYYIDVNIVYCNYNDNSAYIQ